MAAYFNSQGHSVTLGQTIDYGGEAYIHRVVGQPRIVAKVYRKSPPRKYERKLDWMRRVPPDDPNLSKGHVTLAWPQDILYGTRGELVGYLMPFIQDAVPLLSVFNPKLRKATLPGFNWKYLHRVARNLATAIEMIHNRDYVVGDLNESNVLVTNTAMITMIDMDSCQVKRPEGNKIVIDYCPVGKEDYTPPEIQGRAFAGIERTPLHDYFGLGVLIFKLLMDGDHPFRGEWSGTGEAPSIQTKIAKGWFPYSQVRSCPIAPPQGRSLNLLHPGLHQLIVACFENGHTDSLARPTPAQWKIALDVAENALIDCGYGHLYSNHLRACPLCGVQILSPPPVQSSSNIICPYCGKVNVATASCCQNPNCAMPFYEPHHFCMNCGEPWLVNAKCCVNCGAVA